MKINEVQKKDKKTVQISIRTTKVLSDFMTENKISPNAVFEQAVKELMNKE